MAQTNDEETSFNAKEVIIKKTLDEFAKEELISYGKYKEQKYNSWNEFVASRDSYHLAVQDIHKAVKMAVSNARLATLDDCETLLENFIGSDEWDYQYPAVGERRLGRMIYKEELEQLLAELEALRKKVSDEPLSKRGSKKVEG